MYLYKAVYHSVLHAHDIDEAILMARGLAREDCPFSYEEGSVKEITSEEEIPPGWEKTFYPVSNEDGDYSELKIKDVLRDNMASYALKQRVIELEKELSELKTQLDHAKLPETT
jgi:hypothetical protein